MRTDSQIITDLMAAGVVETGHFVLGDGYGNPGLHASEYIHVDRLQDSLPLYSECVQRIDERLGDLGIDFILTPDDTSKATARFLARYRATRFRLPKLEYVSAESDTLRPGPARVLIHDDVLHAGRMVHELLWRIYKNRYEFVGISCLFHRNEGETMFGLPVFPAVQTVFKAVHAEQCPDCTRGLPSTRQYGLAERTLRESWVDENLLPVADTTR